MKRFIPALFLLPLIACGGGPDGTTPAQRTQFNTDLINASGVNNAIRSGSAMAAPASSATTVPTNYSGKLVGGYGYSNGRKGLILGDMSMQVDFDTGDLTGSVTNLAANMEASGASPEVLVSGGSLTLDADYVTAANRYEGTLSGSVNLPKSNGEEDVNKVDIDSVVRAVLYGPTGATEPNAISARFDSPAALPSDIDYLAGTLHAE